MPAAHRQERLCRAKPARYPQGPWPLLLTADMAAAVLGYPDTKELARGVVRGEAPRPTGMRGTGRNREPVWAYDACRNFVARRHGLDDDVDSPACDLKSLI